MGLQAGSGRAGIAVPDAQEMAEAVPDAARLPAEMTSDSVGVPRDSTLAAIRCEGVRDLLIYGPAGAIGQRAIFSVEGSQGWGREE